MLPKCVFSALTVQLHECFFCRVWKVLGVSNIKVVLSSLTLCSSEELRECQIECHSSSSYEGGLTSYRYMQSECNCSVVGSLASRAEWQRYLLVPRNNSDNSKPYEAVLEVVVLQGLGRLVVICIDNSCVYSCQRKSQPTSRAHVGGFCSTALAKLLLKKWSNVGQIYKLLSLLYSPL